MKNSRKLKNIVKNLKNYGLNMLSMQMSFIEYYGGESVIGLRK